LIAGEGSARTECMQDCPARRSVLHRAEVAEPLRDRAARGDGHASRARETMVMKCTHCGHDEVGQGMPCPPGVEGGRVAAADVLLAGRGFGDAGEGEVVFDEASGQ